VIAEDRFQDLLEGASPTEQEREEMHGWLSSKYPAIPVQELHRSYLDHTASKGGEPVTDPAQFECHLRDLVMRPDRYVAIVFDGVVYGARAERRSLLGLGEA
jgi:hypothetical protein